VDAIRLTGHKTAADTIIWVDPRSYLPVRLTDQVHIIRSSDKKETTAKLTIDFRWLPPSRANLKELTAPIPPGFHQVSKPAPRASFNG
jgi:hypothetical protein